MAMPSTDSAIPAPEPAALPAAGPHRLRRAAPYAAALLGAAAGLAFADSAAAGLAWLWDHFFFPAYDAVIKNGLLGWCM